MGELVASSCTLHAGGPEADPGCWLEQIISHAVLPSRASCAAGGRQQIPPGETVTPQIRAPWRTARPRRLCGSFWNVL